MNRFDRLDLLINNAGLFSDTRQHTADGFELTMGVML
jgi:NAD(P)-dependent dehydrogenase (short-subunit alcohol dehydrogenase family)